MVLCNKIEYSIIFTLWLKNHSVSLVILIGRGGYQTSLCAQPPAPSTTEKIIKFELKVPGVTPAQSSGKPHYGV